MTKAEFVAVIAAGTGLSKKAVNGLLETTFSFIGLELVERGRFSFPGFGVWSVRQRKARRVLHPLTAEPHTVKAFRTVKFRPARELKARL